MQMKKIVPLALAAVITSTAVAGAANVPLNTAKQQNSIFTYVCDSSFRQELLEKYLALICGQLPGNRPEETPDVEQPEETPDVEQPEETPDVEQPEETPDVEQPEQTPGEDNDTAQGDYASQVVALVNAERAKYGLSALKADSRVQQAAQVRASETVQSFSHTRPNGSSFSTALTEAGVSYTRSGENIAYGQSTPQQVVNAWMNSSGHRANILNEDFTTIGVGYTVINGTAYWAQLFTA